MSIPKFDEEAALKSSRFALIVGSGEMGCEVDLDECSATFINSIYDPDKRPVCVRILARTHGPNATCSVFRTGAIQASGTTSAALAHDLVRKVARRIQQKLKLEVKLRGYSLKQCSMHGNLHIEEGWQLNLSQVQNTLPDYFRCIYEPEMNPALKVEIYGILVDIFTSGKCIVRGKGDEEDAINAYKALIMEFGRVAHVAKMYQQKTTRVTDAHLRRKNPKAKRLGKRRRPDDDLDDFIVGDSDEIESDGQSSDEDF